MSFRISLSAPDISDDDIQAVGDVLHSSQLSRGPRLVQFERVLADVSGTGHAVGVSSGTAALHLCLHAYGIGEGHEVITTPFTVPAVTNAIFYTGAQPVLADIDCDTLNVDPQRVAAAITTRTRAILAVHTFGRCADMDALRALAERHGLFLLEDACQAIGAQYKNRPAGSLADAGVFAFYPNKPVCLGEGGAVTTNDGALARRLARLRNHGRDAEQGWADQAELGFNYRLAEMSCALGVSRLARLEEILARRARVAAVYHEQLSGDSRFMLPPLSVVDQRLSWFVFVIRLNEEFSQSDRDTVIEQMAARGIQCGRYFAPLYAQPYLRQRLVLRAQDYPCTEAVSRRVLALPFSTNLSAAQIEDVCGQLRRSLASR